MKYLGSFGTYEIANDHQITLLAANIDALVEFVPRGFEELKHSEARRPGYALMVEEERFEEAVALVSLQVQPDYKCMFACTKCGSEKVRGEDMPMFRAFLLLFIPIVIEMMLRRSRGIPYRCAACGNRYRKKI